MTTQSGSINPKTGGSFRVKNDTHRPETTDYTSFLTRGFLPEGLADTCPHIPLLHLQLYSRAGVF
jgi:hypothetical protein